MFGICRLALRFVLPVDCISCDRPLHTDPVSTVCRGCWDRIGPTGGPRCSLCDQPFAAAAATSWTPDHRCQPCLTRPPAFDRAWTPFPYLPPLQDAICAFKYRHTYSLAKPLAALLCGALPADVDGDLLVPVPLHPSRLRAREFNQSLLLADQLGLYLKRPVAANALTRTFATPPQTMLKRRERVANLRHAFAVPTTDAVSGRRILLIDDVYTTGTTLNECAKTLLQAGAASVSALALARTIDTHLVPDRVLAERPVGSFSGLGM